MKRQLLHILSFILIIAGSLSFVWWLQNESNAATTDLTIAEAIAKIDRGEFSEARFTADLVEFTDRNGNKFVTKISSDATRELLFGRIREFMKAGSEGTTMKVTEEPASAPFAWILMRFLPIPLLLIGIGLALGLFLSRFIRK